MMSLKYVFIAARWIFGLWYFLTGMVWIVGHALGRGAQHLEVAAGALAFQKALTASGFMDPLLAVTCLFGGAAMLIRRTVPLGIVILAPVVVIIFFFHVVLSGNWSWGTLNLVWLTALAWRYRKAFTGLWRCVEPTA